MDTTEVMSDNKKSQALQGSAFVAAVDYSTARTLKRQYLQMTREERRRQRILDPRWDVCVSRAFKVCEKRAGG